MGSQAPRSANLKKNGLLHVRRQTRPAKHRSAAPALCGPRLTLERPPGRRQHMRRGMVPPHVSLGHAAAPCKCAGKNAIQHTAHENTMKISLLYCFAALMRLSKRYRRNEVRSCCVKALIAKKKRRATASRHSTSRQIAELRHLDTSKSTCTRIQNGENAALENAHEI